MSTSCGTVQLVPGPKGDPGQNGINGAAGINAISYLVLPFTMPNEGAQALATVDQNLWMAASQVVYLQNAGWMQVAGLVGTNQVWLYNLRNTPALLYLGNVAAGTVAPPTSIIAPAGAQGASGVNGTSGATTNGTYITRAVEASLPQSFSLSGIVSGLLKHTVAAGASTPATAVDGTDYLSPTTGLVKTNNLSDLNSAAAARTNLGLGAVATLGTAAVLQTANALSELTAVAATARSNLGIVTGYGLLGSLTAVNLNASGDNAIALSATTFILDRVVVWNASINTTTATAGVFTAPAAGGTTLAADQSLASLTASTKYLKLSLAGVTGSDIVQTGTIYFRVGTPQGAADTANVSVYGYKLA